MGGLGALLLGLNLIGLATDYELPSGAQPRPTPPGVERAEAPDLKRRSGEREEAYFRRLTEAVHYSLAHWGSSQHGGHDPVAVTDNWVLRAASFVKPSFRDWEFSDHRRALERGWGLCTQHAAVVFDVLRDQGYEPGHAQWGPHSVVVVETTGGAPFVLDADMNVVMPRSLDQIRRAPALVRERYREVEAAPNGLDPRWTGDDVARWALGFYSRPPDAILRGEPYRNRATIENIAYGLKWTTPVALVAWAIWARRRSSRREASRARPAAAAAG